MSTSPKPKKKIIKKKIIKKKPKVSNTKPKKKIIKKKSNTSPVKKKIIKKKNNKNTIKKKIIKKKPIPLTEKSKIDKEYPVLVPKKWIRQNQKHFPSWVTKTFLRYKITGKSDAVFVPGQFKPFLYQMFLRDYMQDGSPYRGILLYHGLGSGKTCSAIGIAENLKTTRNIVVILPASLRDNFIGSSKEGLLFCGDPKYKKNPELIKKKYVFVSSNASNTIAQLNKLGTLDNHVIVIDEAHNLVSRMVGGLNGDNKQGVQIYDKLMNAKNAKIIALTGTPIVNEPYEAGVLFNVLRGYLYISVFKIEKVDEKYGSSWNLSFVEKKLSEIPEVIEIKTNKSNRTMEFQLSIEPWELGFKDLIKKIEKKSDEEGVKLDYITFQQFTLFPDGGDEEGKKEFNATFIEQTGNIDKIKNKEIFQRRILGLVSYYRSKTENFPEIVRNEFVKVVMSGYQFNEYYKVRQEERKSMKLSEIRVFSRQYCNFVFPPDIKRPGISDKIHKNTNSQNEKLVQVMKATENESDKAEVKKEEREKYQKAIDIALKKLSQESDKYLAKDKLKKYSNKFLHMLEAILNQKGLVFVYSDFRSLEGIEVFARVLNANGFCNYTNSKNNTCKNKMKYAFYTGSEDFKERTAMLRVFNSEENKHGKLIKVILATSAGAEGLDLKNIRLVLITEPYWNEVRIQQVIGRAVRRNSHAMLPKNEQNVTVFRYLSVISEKDKIGLKGKEKLSTDQVVLQIAEKKAKITMEMLQVMKETAVDCVLNAKDNDPGITCFNFGSDIDGVAYTPKLSRNLGKGVESETRSVKKVLRHGAVDVNNFVYFIENKKLYKVTDKLKRNPIPRNKIPKMKKKVALNLEDSTVYDHGAAILSGSKIKLGDFDKTGKLIKS